METKTIQGSAELFTMYISSRLRYFITINLCIGIYNNSALPAPTFFFDQRDLVTVFCFFFFHSIAVNTILTDTQHRHRSVHVVKLLYRKQQITPRQSVRSRSLGMPDSLAKEHTITHPMRYNTVSHAAYVTSRADSPSQPCTESSFAQFHLTLHLARSVLGSRYEQHNTPCASGLPVSAAKLWHLTSCCGQL